MTKLTDLAPCMVDWEPNEHGFQNFSFLCPNCRKVREVIAIWSLPNKLVTWQDRDGNACQQRVWSATQGPYKDWDSLSVTPSINTGPHERHGCPGWHGFITNGVLS